MKVMKATNAEGFALLAPIFGEYWNILHPDLTNDQALRLHSRMALKLLEPTVNAIVLVDGDTIQGFMVVEFLESNGKMVAECRELYVREAAGVTGNLTLVKNFIAVARAGNADLVTARVGEQNRRWADLLISRFGFRETSVEIELKTEEYDGKHVLPEPDRQGAECPSSG